MRHKDKARGEGNRAMKTYRPAVAAILDDSGLVDVLRISGELAWDTVQLMENTAGKLELRDGVPLVIDLTNLEFIDSRGIGFLLRLRFAYEDKAVSLASIPHNVRKVLERTFVLNRFFVSRSVSDVEEKMREILETA